MLILAGLLSMFALGSVVFFETSSNDEDETENAEDTSETDETEDGDQPSGLLSYLTETGSDDVSNTPTDAADILRGTDGDDDIDGLAGDDMIAGRAGMDTLTGGIGDDALNGEAGDDTLQGDDGDDHLIGEDGHDLLIGGTGDDTLLGHFGEDMITADAGDDSLLGGAGNDVLAGGAGNDSLHGNDGDDHLVGGSGTDVMMGGIGNDSIDGHDPEQPEQDYLNGGHDDDTLSAGALDIASGGDGADSFVLQSTQSGPAHITDFEPGTDQLVVVYPAGESAPEVDLTTNPNDPAHSILQVGGVTLATIDGGTPLPSDIVMVQDA